MEIQDEIRSWSKERLLKERAGAQRSLFSCCNRAAVQIYYKLIRLLDKEINRRASKPKPKVRRKRNAN